MSESDLPEALEDDEVEQLGLRLRPVLRGRDAVELGVGQVRERRLEVRVPVADEEDRPELGGRDDRPGPVVERERVIVIRPVDTARLSRERLERVAGDALRITPNSLRIRLLDLKVPWQDALDGILAEVERVASREPAAAAT